jgi:hypothetical protein
MIDLLLLDSPLCALFAREGLYSFIVSKRPHQDRNSSAQFEIFLIQ